MRDERRAEFVKLVEAMRAAAGYHPDPDRAPVVLALPFRGTWLARNTPARRVPSHGTHFLGQSFAIDFAAVDQRRRTAAVRDWRTLIAVEPVDRFFAFGRPILAPAKGRVIAVHDDEPDHPARRSPLTLLPYVLTQGSRLRRGLGAVVGNHLILALQENGPYVVLAHLRRLDAGETRRRGHRGPGARGVRQLGKHHPTARARAGHGLPRAPDRPRAPGGIPQLPRVAARRGSATRRRPRHPRTSRSSRTTAGRTCKHLTKGWLATAHR